MAKTVSLIIKELKKRLSEFLTLVDLIVVGSRARGDCEVSSDMDVFIEVENPDRDTKEKGLDFTWKVGFEHYIVISPIICTRTEVEKTPFRSSPILKSILEEGLKI